MRYILTEKQIQSLSKGESNFDREINQCFSKLPPNFEKYADVIKNYVRNYVRKTGFTVKFLNACTSFAGVRTKDQVIICSPMGNLGDFVYTIFHEIRHEQQVSQIKMLNPLTDFDLEDFEDLYRQYWEMELDADQFAKNMVAKLVIKLGIPIKDAKQLLKLSPYIENYPMMSQQIKSSLKYIVETMKKLKSQGYEITDIQDVPMVKQFLDKLENFF